MHLMCTQCSILLHLFDISFLPYICLWQISHIQACLRVVVGPGFVSTSSTFRGGGSASNQTDPHGRLAPKTVNRMRKGDEDWVKKCMEYRVEGRRPVGRPRKTWLESVEADMAELEINKEDVHDKSKWRRNVNVMKRKSNPIGKRTINR